MPKTADKQKQTNVKADLPKVQNVEVKDQMFPFDGAWMPSTDPILIGPKNFQELTNMRYGESGIEGVNGNIDFNATAISDYTNIETGIHFRTNRTDDSYILAHAKDDSGNGRVYYSTSAVGIDEGLGHFKMDFDNEPNKIVDDYSLDAKEFSDWTNGFSTDTQNSIIAPDGTLTGVKLTEDATASEIHKISFAPTIALSSNTDYTVSFFMKAGTKNRFMVYFYDVDASDYMRMRVDANTGTITSTSVNGGVTISDSSITPYPNDWYLVTCSFNTGSTWNATSSFTLRMTETNSNWIDDYDGDGSSYIYIWGAKMTQSSSYECVPKVLHTDVSTNLDGRFSNGPSGAVAYCNQEESLIWEGTEADIQTLFTLANADPDNAGAYPIDETFNCLNRIIADYITMDTSDRADLIVLSTAPLQGIKLYVDPSNPNSNGANTDALVVKEWNGTAMAAVTTLVDGTAKLTTTGTLSFDSTVSTSKPKHYQERYSYAYTIGMTASAGTSSARIYQVTLDKPMQAPTNIWDGIYRQPIQAQRYDNANTAYEDFTVHVHEPSTVELPVGLFLGQITSSDHFIIMFDEPMAAIKFTMLGSLVNILDAQFAAAGGLQYWNGEAYANLTFTDETLDAAGDSSCSQTGLFHWTPPTDEEKTTLFGTIGYAYKFITDGTFTGSADDDEVTVDLVTAIPAQEDIKVYKLASQYKNKLMFCGYVEGNEGNRIDFSVDNNPHMFNGADSSDNGYQSIFVGSVEEITAATQLYNRFGSNILSMFVILKNSEVWLMVGDTPIDYKLYPISFRIGCPAPKTLTTAEVGFEIGEDVKRNVAMWISHQGPVMFDGAIVHPIKGIEIFFDPNEAGSINFDVFNKSQSWFDSTNNEWNVLIPTGASTDLNKWLVYDVIRQRWFEKNTNLGTAITCGIHSIATTGDQFIYGGASDGRIYELETGPSWNGSPIKCTVFTGDFFPTGSQWDETLIRRLKLVTKRLTEDGATIGIFYYKDTAGDSGLAFSFADVTADISNTSVAGIAFTDVTAAISNTGNAGLSFASAPVSALDMSLVNEYERVVRVTKDMNEIGWAHAFKFEFTSSESNKGFQPLMWGTQSLKVRTEQG